MGKLYDARIKIERIIEEKNLDPFMTKGKIGLKSALVVTALSPDTPDDDVKLGKLREAVKEVLNETI